MTVERTSLPAVRYVDERGFYRTMVPMLDPNDGSWWLLSEDGASVYDDAEHIRSFADEWDNDPHFADEDETIAAYRAVADIIDELLTPSD